ncbi:MAG: ASCH domain-containing protein [Candidatus Falkowbacteria bacterium]
MSYRESHKVLVFAGEHFEPTLWGIKQITIRKYRPEAHDFKKDELVIGEFLNGYDMLLQILADTETVPFHDLPDQTAREDGYKNREETFLDLKKYYPDLTKNEKIAIIRYRTVGYTPLGRNKHYSE